MKIAAKSDEDITLLQKLPPQLPWTLKLNHKQLSVPLKNVIRRKKGALKNNPDMNRKSASFQLINVISSGENPRAAPAREGELPGDEAETDD